MLKRPLFALLLLISVAPRFLGDSIALIWFEGNREYFSEVLCVNQDRPELSCKGQCQLAKMLKAQEAPEAPILPETPDNLPFVLISNLDFGIPADGRISHNPSCDRQNHSEWTSAPALPPPRV